MLGGVYLQRACKVQDSLIHRLTKELKAKLLTGPSLPRTFLDPLITGTWTAWRRSATWTKKWGERFTNMRNEG